MLLGRLFKRQGRSVGGASGSRPESVPLQTSYQGMELQKVLFAGYCVARFHHLIAAISWDALRVSGLPRLWPGAGRASSSSDLTRNALV